MTKPLDGVKVLDLTSALSGPVATHTLGDMGAEVIKVEPPEGDSIRDLGPMRHGGMGAMFLHTNRSKRSIVLDLKMPSARAAFLRLAAETDVFVTNTRPKALARLGLSYADLREINPKLIYVGIVGYGPGGPWSDKPAYDDLIQGAAGIPSLVADGADGKARYAPIAIADRVTGMNAAMATLGALYFRANSGRGQYIEVPMFETIAALVLSDHMGGLTFDPPEGPAIYRRYTEVRRPFATADGFICMMVLTDRQWQLFFKEVGRPEVAADLRFAEMASRTRNIDLLYDIVADILSQRRTSEWVETLERVDIPVAILETMDSLMENDHLKQTGFLATVDHPSEGAIKSLTRTSVWSESQPGQTRPTPRLGEHSTEILREAALDEAAIQDMLASGATKESP